MEAARRAPKGTIIGSAGLNVQRGAEDFGKNTCMQCRIKKFNPETIKPHRITLIVARRGSGKSTLMKDLLYNQRNNFHYVLGMCPTMESAQFMRSCMPSACVFDRYVPAKIDELVALQQELAGKGKAKAVLLVLDDVLYDKTALRSVAMRNIFFNGRHLKISLIGCSQYCVDLGPDLRSQTDYVCLLKENSLSNRLKLHRFFFGMIENFNDFTALLDRCTQNFEALILDNTLTSNAVNEALFWYKASAKLPDFKLGSPIFFKLSDAMKRSECQGKPAEGPSKKAQLQVIKEDCSDADEH